MQEPQAVQLLQSSDHLKQYIIELPVVAVLLEVRPEIHVIPLDVHQHSIACKEYVIQPSDVLTLLLEGLVQDKHFEVELLG